MSKDAQQLWAAVMSLIVLVGGCRETRQFYFYDHRDVARYQQVATDIETPPEPCCHETCCHSGPPITPETFEQGAVPPWDLSLQDAIGMAVGHSKIARRLPGAGPPTLLLDNPQALATVYDPAIQASTALGGGGPVGVESALAAFDAQLSATMFWERNERPINVGGFGNVIFAQNAEQDRGVFQAQLSKTNATGGQMFLRNNVTYESSNSPTRGVPSAYDLNYEVGVTQPLLQGAGVGFNRIAGPTNSQTAQPGQVSGAFQSIFIGGVLIARINEDVSLADFEKAIRDMVFNVETAYWDLYVAYRAFDSAKAGRDSALANWRRVKDFQRADVIGGEAVLLAQARSQFYRFRGDMDEALCSLLQAENRLRYLVGLPATDGRLIRPVDDPRRAKVSFDWGEIHIEGLARSVELRRQKWLIKRRELELIASRNFLLPRLDAVALYRWLGAGDDLIRSNGRGVPPFAGSDAFSTLTSGDYQEWQLGVQFSMPLGFRQALANVRNAQWHLAREKARLEGQELELTHALTDAMRNVECQYIIAQRRLDEWLSTQKEVEEWQRILKSGVRAVGRVEVLNTALIDAIAKRAVAETAYYRALVDYNRAITQVHYRKGSLLEYSQVFLAEGPWPKRAYLDARAKARSRICPGPLNYVMCPEPGFISHGVFDQQWGAAEVAAAHQADPGPSPVEKTEEKTPDEPKVDQAWQARPWGGGNDWR